ncbi:hypothetical protein ACS0TY_003376 [Phlomoides rotata]
MGSEGQPNAQKLHYNISMSRRTRKAAQNPKNEEREEECTGREKSIQEQRSLKQLIEGRSSVGEHLMREEEKEQILIVKPRPPDDDDDHGLKRSMVRDYVKIEAYDQGKARIIY